MRRPLLVIFPAYCLGIFIADVVPLPRWLFWLSAFACVMASGWAIHRQWRHTPYLIVGAVVLAGIVRMSAISVVPVNFISAFVQDAPVQVEGTVSEVLGVESSGAGTIRAAYVVSVRNVANPSGRRSADGKMRLTVRQPEKQQVLKPGDRISVLGTLRLPRPGSNPGDPDYRAYYLRRGIGGIMSATGKDIKIIGSSPWHAPLRIMYQLRVTLADAMTRHMGAKEAAVLKGLVFGERTGIPARVSWDFSDTGLVHILSVSGYHVALLAAVIFALLLYAGCPETFAAKVVMFSIICYVLLVGFSPPVLRAAVMAMVLLGAAVLPRKKDVLQALLVAGMVLLIWDPRQIYDIGFQLSFVATGGLILLAPGITVRLTARKVPAAAAQLMSASIAATLAVLPLLADYFQQLSLISLAANLLLSFPVSLLIISGIFAAITGVIWAPLAYLVIIFNNWLTGLLIKSAEYLAGVPFSVIHAAVFPWWLAVFYYLCLAWVFQLYTPGFLPAFSQVWRDARRRIMLLLLCITGTLAVYGYAVSHQGLEVTFLDVGQGDAAVLRTPHGYNVLIDGGSGLRGDGSGYDTGEKIIIPYLRRAGMRELSLVLVSHGHADHAGGLRTVAQYLPVHGLLISADRKDSAPVAELLNVCANRKIPVIKPLAGQKYNLDGVVIEVLSAGDAPEKGSAGNESSMVCRVSYGEVSFLFTGDLEGEAERNLLQGEKAISSTVLKIGHHGSGNGTSPGFLAKVNPSYAVISVGEENPYGHPDSLLLQRLRGRNMQIYRTDRDGAVAFWSDGRRLQVKTCIKK